MVCRGSLCFHCCTQSLEATQPGMPEVEPTPEVGNEATGEGAPADPRLTLVEMGTGSACTGLPCDTGVSAVEFSAATAEEAPTEVEIKGAVNKESYKLLCIHAAPHTVPLQMLVFNLSILSLFLSSARNGNENLNCSLRKKMPVYMYVH